MLALLTRRPEFKPQSHQKQSKTKQNNNNNKKKTTCDHSKKLEMEQLDNNN
jgi:hypothetical protein